VTLRHDSIIGLKPVTAQNWQACANLSVQEEQRCFISSNLQSIAAAQFYPDNCCRAVYADEQLVGFALFGIEQGSGRVKLFRLMIAGPFQGRGYGTAAVRAVLHEMHERWRTSQIYVCHHPGNAVARRLYEGFGFREVERTKEKVTLCKDAEGPRGAPAEPATLPGRPAAL
jgi:diamine N-acetyltransferase